MDNTKKKANYNDSNTMRGRDITHYNNDMTAIHANNNNVNQTIIQREREGKLDNG